MKKYSNWMFKANYKLLKNMTNKEAQKILDFWFPKDVTLPWVKWFQKDENFDKSIKEKFENHIFEYSEGKLDEWKNEPKSMLALIILNDQFTRNIYRNTPKAFAYDKLALQLANESIERGYEKEYNVFERPFLYLPFEHSEDKEYQKKSVDLFQKLLKEYPEDAWAKNSLQYSISHKKIIDKWGRFPHRNRILNRESTKEEEEFLKTEGSSF